MAILFASTHPFFTIFQIQLIAVFSFCKNAFFKPLSRSPLLFSAIFVFFVMRNLFIRHANNRKPPVPPPKRFMAKECARPLDKPPKMEYNSNITIINHERNHHVMKKLTALLLCLLLCVAAFAACAPDTGTTEETTDATEVGTAAPSEETTAAAEETTEAIVEDTVAEETTAAGEETQDPADQEYDPELYVVIRTAEDLMALNKAAVEDGEYFDDMTVIFLADIDMTGYTWTPMAGDSFYGVTFEGNGHTISNLQFAVHEPAPGTTADQIGSGFIGISTGDLTFQNLTIDTATVTAFERAVGCFVGVQTGGYISFENCSVKNFTADGWLDYNNQDRANDGHPISFRLAGFVGHNMAGQLYFNKCHVENVKLSGFHNMAAFVGYGSAMLDEYAFEECTVKNLECTFSYCLSDSYTVDMPRKFVSVFFNHAQWIDKVDACVEMGNTFEGVSYYDWTDDNAEYTPSDFASWSDEEANAGA